ncbi:hypothetical protein [Paraburkholderia youngii]
MAEVDSETGAPAAREARLFIKEHIMTPSELDNWDTDTPVWTPYRPVQH